MLKPKGINLYKEEVTKLTNNEYSVLSNFYKDNKTKIRHKHNICGHEYYVKPNRFLSGDRCPQCYGTKLKTTDEYKLEIFQLVGDEYSVLDEYKNANSPILHRHNVCGTEYYVRPVDFVRKSKPNRCPECSTKVSKGELKIMNFLKKKGISFTFNSRYTGEIEKEFKYLTFDFMINEKTYIEYDGELHFQPFSLSENSLKKFEGQKKRDIYKDKLCKENNIKLIRISYKEFDDIEKILEREL